MTSVSDELQTGFRLKLSLVSHEPVMRNLATEARSTIEPVDHAGRNVELQKRIIAAMRFDDPLLPKAYALLRQMERVAAAAEISQAFARHAQAPLSGSMS